MSLGGGPAKTIPNFNSRNEPNDGSPLFGRKFFLLSFPFRLLMSFFVFGYFIYLFCYLLMSRRTSAILPAHQCLHVPTTGRINTTIIRHPSQHATSLLPPMGQWRQSTTCIVVSFGKIMTTTSTAMTTATNTMRRWGPSMGTCFIH